jgi:hypothetical protein
VKRFWLWLLALVFAGVVAPFSGPFSAEDSGQGMGCHMMGGGHRNMMRDMMQRMMGDALPPGIDPAPLPEPHSQGARLLKRFCTQCHALPDPKQHTVREWPDVVARMQKNMVALGKALPDEATLKGIIGFLQRHGR